MKRIKALLIWIEFLMFNVMFSVLFPEQTLYILILFILVSLGALYYSIKEDLT